MITLQKITEENFEECLALSVSEGQKRFVASNAYSLAEAYALTNHSLQVPLPYAVYYGDEMVGFAFAVYQPRDESDPSDTESVYYLARMMIDKNHQGKGFGKAAVANILETLKSCPCGKADAIVLACSPQNEPAYSLYKSFGFIETGETDDDGDNLLRLDMA